MKSAQIKRREAVAFVETIQRRENSSYGMSVDPSLLAAGRSPNQVSPSWLAACMATLQVPLRRCVLVGASLPTLKVWYTFRLLLSL